MKTQLIQSMGSFVLGGSVALVGLLSWTGTTDLQEIRSAVQGYMVEVEEHSSALAEDYQVSVNSANAEIGEYKEALAQANSNISQLITAYNNAETKHQEELKQAQDDLTNANATYEQDMKDLQAELADMQTRLDSQYETDMNKVIEQANGEIQKANQEVAQTKENVLKDLQTSQVDEYVENAKKLKDQLDTGNDKSVTDISSVVPQE